MSDGAKFRVRKWVIEDWNPPARCKSPNLKTVTVLITVDHGKRKITVPQSNSRCRSKTCSHKNADKPL